MLFFFYIKIYFILLAVYEFREDAIFVIQNQSKKFSYLFFFFEWKIKSDTLIKNKILSLMRLG